jgi:anti-sigma factor RsiW
MSWLFGEPPHDPKLGAALRNQETGAGENLEPLQQRIIAAARPRLVEIRSPSPRWWEWISRWMPVAVPVGLAATLAAGLLVPAATDLTTLTGTEAASDSTLVIAAFAESPAGGELASSLIAPGTADWLWQQAVAQ